ncbi:hypothetical protein LMG31884_16880 [Xanthomonas hydrangeae]|uniref:DUF418 domain-containing protein n=1 Tax=Xanthomonas hydrangeae TaxID=2775159 RepID=UPI001965E34A|nr:hypothetical protein LMG31884_16880 [Xanthomonas hydrangeae]CAD7715545.1 hypothetical protein LMG31884_16880 [Xanthomonas hydrangeae]CAD7728208.1 hypothetical protein LMG31887_16870 [Xanthomonas hydrangeae]CAD7728212.1 hypothetical protein LMG31887_16870 [Xanthomonas hydrangeae]
MTPRDFLQPIAATERIVVLDVLRGFALLGILLMNIEAFVGPLDLALTGVDPHWHGIDRVADALVYLFVQGKFYTLFALLFGMGFAVMAQRAEQAGRVFFGMYLRRTLGLLAIGLAHALLLWSGDILVTYALLALLLLATRSVPTVTLPWVAALVYCCAPGLMLLYGVAGALTQADPAAAVEWKAAMADAAQQAVANVQTQRAAYGSGTYLQATLQRWHDLQEAMSGLSINGPAMLGMFLLGSWFVRSGAIAAPERFPRLFRMLRYGVLPLGLGVMLVSYALEPWMDPARLDLRVSGAFALSLIAGPLMSLGYAAWVVQLAPRLACLAPAGRMALTNYLLQSLLCTWVFYGYGLGYFEQLPRMWQLPFALGLFALQVVLSQLWLRWFRFGPMEWLWRSVTYLRVPPMRHGSARLE